MGSQASFLVSVGVCRPRTRSFASGNLNAGVLCLESGTKISKVCRERAFFEAIITLEKSYFYVFELLSRVQMSALDALTGSLFCPFWASEIANAPSSQVTMRG